jgi:serine/threonine-protein kinase
MSERGEDGGDETILEAVLADYLLAEENGGAPDPGQVLAAHPHLAGELAAFFVCRRTIPRLGPARRDAEPCPQTLGDFSLLEVLGRGGMGIVYRARQRSLGRLVAVKVLRGERGDGEDADRFRREGEKLARLRHPHVVQIFGAGEDAGRPYFAMELVEGGSLATRLAAGWLPTARQAAALVRTLAEAVAYLHERDILHRDLKPANILLDERDEPKIADFGLAKQTDDGSLTARDVIVGTVIYMAPEQARGQGAGRAADIYALGAILYELLAGRPPFLGATVYETLEQVVQQEPLPLRRLCPGIDPDLEAICLKCLSKRPEGRYAGAAGLADDLGRYLRGEPIRAAALGLFGRVARTVSHAGLITRFHASSNDYFLAAAAFFAAHVLVFVALYLRAPEGVIWVALTAPHTLLFRHFHSHRHRYPWMAGWVDRQIWSIWLGHFLAAFALFLAFRIGGRDPAEAVAAGYPGLAALTGLAFFIMGSDYWGRYYLFGLGYLAGAVVMAVTPAWAPLEMAALAALCLTQIALFMRRLDGLQEAPGAAGDSKPFDSGA